MEQKDAPTAAATTSAPSIKSEDTTQPAPASVPPSQPPHSAAIKEEDSDPDLDDLDDVLDQFSASAAPTAPLPAVKQPTPHAPSASGPGRPAEVKDEIVAGNLSEEELMAHLQEEMSKLISTVDSEAGPKGPSTAEDLSHTIKELDAFTQRMEAEGVKPEDLLKAILGEDAANSVVNAAKAEGDQDEIKAESSSSAKVKKEEGSEKKATTSTFEDTIRRTMARMEASDANATEATHTSSTEEEDMLAQLLKAMESGEGDGVEGDMSKMFLGMMEQLTNKEMLYEPMKELNENFPEYLKKNKSTIPAVDFTRYSNQQRIVKEIVTKFEERGYSDEDAGCRAYIWERMQAMQAEGSPPVDLVANPFPGMGVPGLGGGGGEGEDVGCPPQ